jgi:hypothetical protein
LEIRHRYCFLNLLFRMFWEMVLGGSWVRSFAPGVRGLLGPVPGFEFRALQSGYLWLVIPASCFLWAFPSARILRSAFPSCQANKQHPRIIRVTEYLFILNTHSRRNQRLARIPSHLALGKKSCRPGLAPSVIRNMPCGDARHAGNLLPWKTCPDPKPHQLIHLSALPPCMHISVYTQCSSRNIVRTIRAARYVPAGTG